MTFENLQTASNAIILVGALMVAIGGYGNYYYGNKIQSEKESNKLKSLSENYISDLNKLIKPLKKQSENITEFKKIIEDDNRSIGFIFIQNLVGVQEQFKQYDYNLLLAAFGKEKEKPLYDLRQEVALIDSVLISIKSSLEEFKVSINQHKNTNTNNINKIFEIRDYIYLEYNSKKINLNKNPFVVEFFNTCEEHLEVADEYKLFFGEESLINPLLKLREKYIGKDEYLNQINLLILSSSSCYKGMSNALSDLYSEMDRSKEQIEGISIGINSNLEKLDK